MHLTVAALVASLTLVASVAASPQSGSRWPLCIQDCVDNHAVSSFCDGDETGEALANCTCNSFFGSSLLECLKGCSPEEQGEYASEVIKGDCRDTIFPDATYEGGNDDDDSSDDDKDDSETTTASESSEPTSTDEEEQPMKTEEEDNDEDGAAMGLNVPAALAVGGLFAAFLM